MPSLFNVVSNQKTLTYLFGIGVGVSLTFLAANRYQLGTLSQAERSSLIIDGFESVESLLVNAETGQRGFLLTAERDYLQPFFEAAPKIDRSIAQLERRIDDPIQQARIKQIAGLADKKIEELQQTIDLASEGKIQSALAIVKADKGKRYLDEIRAITNEAVAQESQILKDRRDRLIQISGYGVPILIATTVAVLFYTRFFMR